MHHDCVVVPGFGAFMLNHESARYDSATQRFLPPSRTLGFNPEVRHNDALLLGSISRREGMSLDAARSALETSVGSLRHQMQLCGEVAMGRLGVFTPGPTSESPVFNPSADSLPVRRFDGLQPLEILPLDYEEKVGGEAAVTASSADDNPVIIPFPLKVVASIVAVIVGLGILYSTTSLVNSPRVNFASLDTGISSRIERVIDSTVSVSREILLNIAMPPAETGQQAAVSPEEAVAEKPQPSIGRYILVVGSFPSARAAERHIAQTGDESLRFIEMDGNYRVYVASASHINDARALAATLSERYPSVWVCRR